MQNILSKKVESLGVTLSLKKFIKFKKKLSVFIKHYKKIAWKFLKNSIRMLMFIRKEFFIKTKKIVYLTCYLFYLKRLIASLAQL